MSVARWVTFENPDRRRPRSSGGSPRPCRDPTESSPTERDRDRHRRSTSRAVPADGGRRRSRGEVAHGRERHGVRAGPAPCVQEDAQPVAGSASRSPIAGVASSGRGVGRRPSSIGGHPARSRCRRVRAGDGSSVGAKPASRTVATTAIVSVRPRMASVCFVGAGRTSSVAPSPPGGQPAPAAPSPIVCDDGPRPHEGVHR